MNTLLSVKKNLIPIALVGALTLAACSAPTTVAPVAIATKAPPTATQPLPTATVAKPTATTAPTLAPSPTTAPTQAASPTAQASPTVQPTATAIAMLPLNKAEVISNLSIMPDKLVWQAQSGSDKPKAGNTYLFVTVVLQNTSKTDTIKFDPTQMLLIAPDGSATVQLVSLKSATNELTAQSLKPGAKVTGVVIYEVPQSQQKDKWALEFKGANSAVAQWSLAG